MCSEKGALMASGALTAPVAVAGGRRAPNRQGTRWADRPVAAARPSGNHHPVCPFAPEGDNWDVYDGTHRAGYKRQSCPPLCRLCGREGMGERVGKWLCHAQSGCAHSLVQNRAEKCTYRRATYLNKKRSWDKRSWDKIHGSRINRLQTKQDFGRIREQSQREFQRRKTLPRANETQPASWREVSEPRYRRRRGAAPEKYHTGHI